jgi:O-acetyl-ADP-ribose deacetylase (regulator of RNase III)
MARGIAATFLELFGGRDTMTRQQPAVGRVLEVTHSARPAAVIFALVTKQHFYGKPTLSAIRVTLVRLRDRLITHRLCALAFPLLGCGLDQLRWQDVEAIIIDVFSAQRGPAGPWRLRCYA